MNNRPNKQAVGFTKHYERREKQGRTRISNPKHPLYKSKDEMIVSLIVRGTLDELRGKMFLTKKIKIEHPIDKGFFKEAIVLTDSGRALLKRKKRELRKDYGYSINPFFLFF